jgi:hypothetical protein
MNKKRYSIDYAPDSQIKVFSTRDCRDYTMYIALDFDDPVDIIFDQ